MLRYYRLQAPGRTPSGPQEEVCVLRTKICEMEASLSKLQKEHTSLAHKLSIEQRRHAKVLNELQALSVELSKVLFTFPHSEDANLAGQSISHSSASERVLFCVVSSLRKTLQTDTLSSSTQATDTSEDCFRTGLRPTNHTGVSPTWTNPWTRTTADWHDNDDTLQEIMKTFRDVPAESCRRLAEASSEVTKIPQLPWQRYAQDIADNIDQTSMKLDSSRAIMDYSRLRAYVKSWMRESNVDGIESRCYKTYTCPHCSYERMFCC